MDQLTETLNRFENNKLWTYYISISDEIAQKYIEGKDRRVVCTLNDKESMHCALMPSPRGYFILINQALKKKLGLHLGESVQLKIEKDRSKYGMSISEEFETCLKEEPIAYKYFEELTPGKQRNLIHMVNQVKSSEIKIRRSLAIVEHLITEKGKIEFKRLNQLIKSYNQNHRL
ncbi:MAG: YdeI/OmpD-associated family protein [Vicingaceae bacterium]